MSNTIIIGTGIIGCSTAYYLSESPRSQAQSIHLVEAAPELFKCASGLAGGILAEDWFSPDLTSLGALSFKLHKELAEAHNGKERWGYSRSTASSLSQDPNSTFESGGTDWLRDGTSRAAAAAPTAHTNHSRPSWMTEKEGHKLEVISKEGTFAQVNPKELCEFLLGECVARGVVLHHPARVVSVSKDARDQLASVRIVAADGTEIPCTRLIITAGAWSPKVFAELFPSSRTTLPISSLAGHSIIMKSLRWTKEHEDKGCHAVFAVDAAGYCPEFVSRIGGEIFFAGLNSAMIPLPNLPTDAKIEPEAIKQLKDTATALLGAPGKEDDIKVVKEGLCFRPITPKGRPIIARIPDARLGGAISTRSGAEGGVFVSAGHGPWGIAQSLGTGKVLSEMLENQPTSANVDGLGLF
ncbi:nucleotide-binding domain-containing protein [Tothia fuscella]|uniref:Nucleotide-binding domain-containing protein n=1 Tax=Tothia fuscella TaxID=1048955 RepID=A0A9P4TWD9_9PEZI|nr:nucleotide-binding domain-containing protein [Tothia fuscella]